jgi:type I restriction enzyme S subunit
MEVELPDKETQHTIASILFQYDILINNYQQQIKLMDEASRRLFKEWFVDFHFPGYENVKITNGVPEKWESQSLGEIADITMGQSPKSEYYNIEKKGLPFHQGVGSYGVRFVNDTVYSSKITRLAPPNSILFSVRAPVGRLNITKNKIIIGRGIAAITHKLGLQSFLFYMLKERFFMDNIIGNGAIFASISKDELYGQKFMLPPLELMKQYNTIVSKYDDCIENADTQIHILTEARDRLLPKLMSGEIEV